MAIDLSSIVLDFVKDIQLLLVAHKHLHACLPSKLSRRHFARTIIALTFVSPTSFREPAVWAMPAERREHDVKRVANMLSLNIETKKMN